jgi:hypothetical protein
VARMCFKPISLGELWEGLGQKGETEMMVFFVVLSLVLFVVLLVLVWADTAQVIYTAKRFGHYCQRHHTLLRSHHYFLAAVAIATKSLSPALVVFGVMSFTGWSNLATLWVINGLLVAMALHRSKVIERNQERIDSLRWHNTLLKRIE